MLNLPELIFGNVAQAGAGERGATARRSPAGRAARGDALQHGARILGSDLAELVDARNDVRFGCCRPPSPVAV
jgi:hypothetical protein